MIDFQSAWNDILSVATFNHVEITFVVQDNVCH